MILTSRDPTMAHGSSLKRHSQNNQNHFVSSNSDINKISVNDILTRMEELDFI